MSRHPMLGQLALCTPIPLPVRSLPLNAQADAAGDTRLKARASADEAHARLTIAAAIVADELVTRARLSSARPPCRADVALRADVGGVGAR